MTTKRIVSSLLCLGALAAACGPSAEPAPGDDAPSAEPPRGRRAYESTARRVGSNVDVSLASNERGGRDLSFEGASFVRLHFASLALAPDARMVIEGADGETLNYTAASNGSNVWAPVLIGDKVSIRLERDGDGETGSYAVDQAGVGFPAGADAFNPVATVCGTNDLAHAVCFSTSTHALYNPSVYTASRAVAQIAFAVPGGQAYCTGWLLSNTNLFLTNYHCIPNQTTADSITTTFNFQIATCGQTSLAPKESISGAVFLRGSAELDYALLRLPSNQVPPQNPVGSAPLNPASKYGFLTIDPAPALRANESEVYIPQHAGGSSARKQVAFTDSEASGQRCRVRAVDLSLSENKAGANIGYLCDTQGGSSGSPVISTATHKAVALHHEGGDCAASYNYGINLRDIYPEIKCHIEGTTCEGGGGGGGVTIPANSCQTRCGGQAPAGCFCDAKCANTGDCCPDKAQLCGTGSAATSCEGRCTGDQQAPSGCWCDPGCVTEGDCCADRALFCGLTKRNAMGSL